jgi:predicted transcriptional regulator
MRTIEVDENTAELLQARATERGVSVAQVVADLVAASHATVPTEADELAELDRRWAAIEAGAPTIPHDEVARWLTTWGTPAFKPWRER